MGKLSRADIVVAEGKNRVKKLEEDNEKLRRALEQSMTRLNRMSVDSDFLVDRSDSRSCRMLTSTLYFLLYYWKASLQEW